MTRCKATLHCSSGDLRRGKQCPDDATHGEHCWVHAQRGRVYDLPPLVPSGTAPRPRTITVHILGDVR